MEETPVRIYPPIPDDAPFLFMDQDKPFAGDIHMEGEFINLRDRFKVKTVIETGTCYGSTTLWLCDHFEKVMTCESHEPTLNVAKQRLTGTKADLWFGPSQDVMTPHRMLAHVEGQALFFLDAHFEDYCPLLDELKAIADAGIKPVIVIHDFQVPGRPDLGFDTWNGQPLRFSWIRHSLDTIYGMNGYGHYFNHQATGQKRGVIYIHPNP